MTWTASSANAAAIARRPPVGREMNGDAALGQRRRERLGREQMAARPTGRNEHRRPARFLHQMPRPASTMSPESCARGRSRVSATSMPMP